jgi:hypothetical protein
MVLHWSGVPSHERPLPERNFGYARHQAFRTLHRSIVEYTRWLQPNRERAERTLALSYQAGLPADLHDCWPGHRSRNEKPVTSCRNHGGQNARETVPGLQQTCAADRQAVSCIRNRHWLRSHRLPMQRRLKGMPGPSVEP